MSLALPRIDAVAFDLDGTLVDSAADIQHALNLALESAGLARHDLASVRAWIGDGPDALIERALARQGRAGAPAELRLQLRRAFDAATLAAPLSEGCLFPGIAALVAGLRGVLPMAVVTNKPTALARAVLDAACLLHAFEDVHGADAPEQRKPAPTLLLMAASRLGVAPERLLMVGDSVHDLQCARAAGCPVALVDWGYGRREPMGFPPLRVADPVHLLQGLLATRAGYEPIPHS
ncbi:MAG: HAD-IA family hydrolase [Burkholderiales bacterium]